MSTERSTHTRRVLLVEDNLDHAAEIHSYLEKFAAVTHRQTLREATRLAQRQMFDVALADASLPDAPDGSAVNQLAVTMRFPVILLADHDDPALADLAVRAGAQDYLVKGQFQASELVKSIVSSIHRHEALVQYRRLLESCPDSVLIVNHEGTILLANPAAESAFEMELIGTSIGHPIARDEATEIHLRSGRTAEMRVAEVPWDGATAYLMMLRDVSDRVQALADLKRMTQQLEEQALVDPLTHVLNRRGMSSALAEILAEKLPGSAPTSAILLDCDNFKAINETGGYTAGDATLQLVAQTLVSSVRPRADRIGRIGGDEFLILLPNTWEEDALVVAERIRTAVQRTPLVVSAAHQHSGVTVSLGVTAIPPTVSTLNEVVALAQGGLVEAKRSGKDQVRGGLHGRIMPAPNRAADLHRLIRSTSSIGVAAQAIVRPEDAAIVGYELLARGPDGHPLRTPDALFAAARREKILAATDLLCLRRCMEAAALISSDCVHLNLFPSTLMDTPADLLLEILSSDIACGIVLELNEQEFIGDIHRLLPQLRALRAVGIRLGLDDVGFGRSSLETLLATEPEVVKLDRCTISGIAQSQDKRLVLRRMITCITSLEAEVVAEGVETAEDAQVLLDLGVPFAQGWYWGRPKFVLEGGETH